MMDLRGFNFDEHGVLLLLDDWLAMERAIDRYNIKTIIEFGSGFSTRLFCAKGLKVISYEQSPEWAEKVSEMCPTADIRIYDGSVLEGPTAQMVFIDSPWCDGSDPRFVDRRNAYASAIGMQAKIIACYDAEREGDAALEKEFLAPKGALVDQSRKCHVYEMKQDFMKSKYHYASKVPIIAPKPVARVGFVHFPKAGGTFLYAWLRITAGEIYYFQHNPARMIAGYGLPLIGMVRNPFAWYVSRYFYYRRCLAVERGISKGCDAGLPCEGFCNRFPNFKEHLIWGMKSELPNFTFTQMHTKMFTVNGKSIMHKIGHIENMGGFIHDVIGEFGISPRPTFEDYKREYGERYMNKSEHLHYSKYYDPELRAIVEKSDGALINHYGYEMEKK